MRAFVLCAALVAFGCSTTMATFSSFGGARMGTPESASKTGKSYAHYLAAMMHFRNGRLDDAILELNEALEYAPDSVTLLTALIDAHLMKQDYDTAVSVVEHAVAKRPDDPGLRVLQGRIYQALDQTEKAIEAFEKLVELAPDSPDGLTYLTTLAALEENTNDLVAAIEVYEELVRLHPESALLQYQLALTLARINDSDGARRTLEKVLEIDATFNRARYLLAVVDFEDGRNAEALSHLEAYAGQEPDDKAAQQTMGAVLGRLGRYDEAIGTYRSLIASGDGQPIDQVALAYLLLRDAQYTQVADAVPATGAPVLATLLRGIARKLGGEPYREVFEPVDKIDTDLDIEGTEYVNELLHLFGDAEAGGYLEREFRALVDEGLGSKSVETLLARIYLSTERPRDAEAVLLGVMDRYEADKWTHYYLALAYEELKEFDKLEAQLKASLEIDPNDPDVLNFLGYSFADRNVKLDEARTLIEKALQIDPENGYYLDSLGWVYYRQNNAEQAILLVRRAIQAMENDDAILRDHLGDAYLLHGDVRKALAEWRRALRLDPEIEGVREKIDTHQIAETRNAN